MISVSQIRSLVEDTCQRMGDKFASEDAISLVVATGIVESRYEYIRQMGDGPQDHSGRLNRHPLLTTLLTI